MNLKQGTPKSLNEAIGKEISRGLQQHLTTTPITERVEVAVRDYLSQKFTAHALGVELACKTSSAEPELKRLENLAKECGCPFGGKKS